MKLLKPYHPRTRTKLCNEEINNEISGVLERGTFKYVEKKKLPKESNIIEEYFYYESNNQAQKPKNTRLYSFHMDTKKRKSNLSIIHILRKVRHKNIKSFISISVIYKRKVWNNYVNQAYVQAHGLERDVYVTPDPWFNLKVDKFLKLKLM